MAKRAVESQDLDIALAVRAHAMFSRLLNEAQRESCASSEDVREFLHTLARTEGWEDIVSDLHAESVTAEDFIFALESGYYREFEILYRFAGKEAREFLKFDLLRMELRAIKSAVRRIEMSAGTEFRSPVPKYFREMDDYRVGAISRARSVNGLLEAVRGSVFEERLRILIQRKKTLGQSFFSELTTALNARYYEVFSEFVRKDLVCGGKRQLMDSVALGAELRNAAYLLRLRRFGTSYERVKELMLPLGPSLKGSKIREILEAPSDYEAMRLVMNLVPGRHVKLRSIEMSTDFQVTNLLYGYHLHVFHSTQSLATVYSYLNLREMEIQLLQRMFVSLEYGIRPINYLI